MRNMSIINVVNFNNPPSVIHKRSRHKFGKNRRLEQHSQQLDLIDNNKNSPLNHCKTDIIFRGTCNVY